MNVPAEKPGSRTRLARAATDPSTEYAGALRWNSGSEVIRRSSGVSSSHHGNPSPAIAYARCVWVTSFDRPVVPDVGINTAGSSGRAGPGPASGGAARENSASTLPSSTTSFGSTCPASPASSDSVERGSTATWMAPRYIAASQVNRYSGRLRAVASTRSPGPAPSSARAAAARPIRSRACA